MIKLLLVCLSAFAIQGFYDFDDFMGSTINTNNLGFTSGVSGTGAAVSVGTTTAANVHGLYRLSTGTTATGRAGLNTGLTSLLFGYNQINSKWILQIPTLSDGVETYAVRFGFCDSISADCVDGAYFEYVSGTSPNWIIKTANNSVRTSVTSSIPVTTSMNTFRIEYSPTTVSFYINSVLAGTIDTNIPQLSGRQFGMAIQIIKSLGVTARVIDLDYVSLMIK